MDVQLIELKEAHVNRVFLSNEGNKVQFISLLRQYLQCDGQAVYNSTGDADTMIVANALRIASEGNEINVVADDTDVLIMLMHHWMDTIADVYFCLRLRSHRRKVYKFGKYTI